MAPAVQPCSAPVRATRPGVRMRERQQQEPERYKGVGDVQDEDQRLGCGALAGPTIQPRRIQTHAARANTAVGIVPGGHPLTSATPLPP